VGYWLAWALYPVAGPGFNWQSLGVPPDWTHHYTGFSIAAYLIAHWFEEFIVSSFRINLGRHVLQIFGTALEPLTQGAVVLFTYWLILFWMYRRKLFLKI
jgi:predicted acyltransferase